MNCADGQAYNIALDCGLNCSGNWRNVAYSPWSAMYVLFHGAIGRYEWGDSDYANTYPAPSLADTGTGSDQPHAVYGELWPFSGIPAGTVLTDMVTGEHRLNRRAIIQYKE